MDTTSSSIWKFQADVTGRLLLWSAFSIGLGVAMLFMNDPWWRGFASQFIVWGGIDGVIAVYSMLSSRKKQAALLPTTIEQVESEETRFVRLLLLVNTVLDVFYVLGGFWLAYSRPEFLLQGIGWGIICQGGFLFFFDLIHTIISPKP